VKKESPVIADYDAAVNMFFSPAHTARHSLGVVIREVWVVRNIGFCRKILRVNLACVVAAIEMKS